MSSQAATTKQRQRILYALGSVIHISYAVARRGEGGAVQFQTTWAAHLKLGNEAPQLALQGLWVKVCGVFLSRIVCGGEGVQRGRWTAPLGPAGSSKRGSLHTCAAHTLMQHLRAAAERAHRRRACVCCSRRVLVKYQV